jgi:hypothetical protein
LHESMECLSMALPLHAEHCLCHSTGYEAALVAKVTHTNAQGRAHFLGHSSF